MASHQESRLPQPGRDKRRSFLPAPSKISNLPTKQTNSREGSPSRDPRELREPRELRDPRDHRELREPRDHREVREPRDHREVREPRDHREFREPRDHREFREPRDHREVREPRDHRELREPREFRDPRDHRELRDPRELREPRELRDPRDGREPREFRDPKEHRELREPRELRYPRELQEPKPRRDLREAKEAREVREPVEPLEHGIKVGDRICISGVKHGILRYVGEVHIASGIWCGIELDDPDGKHDGEVEGRRYFFCRKSHGVFAPVDKVELVQAVDVPIKQVEIIPENVLKRRSLPRPASALVKSSLPSVRPVSTGSIADVRKQVVDERREEEEEAVAAPTEKGKGSVIQQKSQIAKISGIPRVGLTSALPSSQLKQQDGSTDLRPKKDIRSVFSNLITDEGDDKAADDRYGSSEDVKEGSVSSVSSDQTVSKLQKPSRLPGASRLPTKFSKLDRQSPTEPKPPPSEEVQKELQPQVLSKTVEVKDVNKTFEVKQDSTEEVSESLPEVVSQAGDEDNADLTRQLKSDSRQFLNITFDAENHSQSPQSLPDVVSSASMSPESGSEIDPDSLATKGNTDEASIDALDDEAMWDNTDLLDDLDRETKMAEDRIRTDDDSSPLVASTPLPVARRKKYTDGDIAAIDFSGSEKGRNAEGIKDLFPKLGEGDANMNATFEVDEDVSFVTEDSDGKSAGQKCDLIDTVSSNNDLNSSNLEHTFVVEKGITDISMPLAEMEEVCELDKTKVEDILEGMSKSVVMDLEKALDSNDKSMIDSGIMDPVTLNRRSMTESGIVCSVQQENRKSMTESVYQDLVKQDRKSMIDSGISDGSMSRSQQLDLDDQQRLEADLKAGQTRRERPLSLISTTSADTGYVADTDSEAGTLTTTSPLDWMDKHGSVEPNLSSVQELDDSYRDSFSEGPSKLALSKDLDRDSDNFSDGGIGGKGVVSGQDSDMDESCLPIPEMDLTGLSPLPSDSILQEQTAKAPSPSSANSSLIEDDRAEADQILIAKGGNPESSAENTLKDLSDASPDGGEMPVEESVISGEVTTSQKDTSINDTANESASQDKSVVESSSVTDESAQENVGDKSAIDLDKSGTDSVKTPAKGKSATPASKKKSAEKVIEHKKPNLNVRSSLADYIRAPVPTKPKEEKEDDSKAKKNVVNKKRADNKKSDVGKSLESANEEGDNEAKRVRPKIEKEPPKIIKRTPPKSKWDNIMSQIDSTKVPKPKPKSEIKSKLEVYLSTPAPVKKEREPKKETKPKSFVMSTPKPDYSKVKSKLSISTPPPPPKRDTSPAGSKKSPRHKSPASKANGNIVLDLSESLDNSISSVRSSRTDLSMDNVENGSESPHPSKLKTPRGSISRIAKTERPSSVTSNLSDCSQGSVKLRNAKNKKSEVPKSETPIKKKFSNVKSSIPPPAPRKPPPSKTSPKKSPETSNKDVSKTSPKRNGNNSLSSLAVSLPSTPLSLSSQTSPHLGYPRDQEELETEIETELETEIETELETEIETELETEIETELETERDAQIESEFGAYDPNLSDARHTGALEGFNNHILMYAPKRHSYSFIGYRTRNKLAAIDHNHHLHRPEKVDPNGDTVFSGSYSKRSQRWRPRTMKQEKNYSYKTDLQLLTFQLKQSEGEGGLKRKTPMDIDDPKLISSTIAKRPCPPIKDLVKERITRFAKK